MNEYEMHCLLSVLQISSLVTLQLLSQVGHDDQLDSPKYKCSVSLDFILAISRCVCVCEIVRPFGPRSCDPITSGQTREITVYTC